MAKRGLKNVAPKGTEIAPSIRGPVELQRRYPASSSRLGRMMQNNRNRDIDIQASSDLINRRSPDEESEVRDTDGPLVPRRPFNVSGYLKKKLR